MDNIGKKICYNSYDPCPCKIVNFRIKKVLCNFVKMFGELTISNNKEELERLIQEICPKMRNMLEYHDNDVAKNQEEKKKFLSKVMSGDKVFCFSEIDEVIFLEKNVNIYGDCTYRSNDGKIRKAPSFAFRILSKGNKCGIYKTSDENRADSYTLKAKKSGYRVEKQKEKEIFILKIFGDDQKEIDEFIDYLYSDLPLKELDLEIEIYGDT